MVDKKVAVITGGNAGIGLSLAERLLSNHSDLHLCLACRNEQRAEAARKALQLSHPSADISIVILDTSNVKSVLNAAEELKAKFQRIDYLYLNAGIMQVSKVRWDRIISGLTSSRVVHVLTTGEGLLQHEDGVTDEGLKKVFATNLFGHFVLVRELEDILGGDSPSQIIWTSSENASGDVFSIEDMQHEKGDEPYSSSKYATDILSISLNEKLNQKNVYSHSSSPGLVFSNLLYGILPWWFWYIVFPFLCFMRLFVSTLSINTYNGSESLLWLSKQKPESLDPRTMFVSKSSVLGNPYVEPLKMKVNEEDVMKLYPKLEEMYQDFKTRYSQS